MMRNTSPIGWIPLLLIKILRDKAFVPFLVSGVVVAIPIVFLVTVLDSWYYSQDLEQFEWTFTGLNFMIVNVVEGLSKYFGDHPTWFYVFAFMPGIFTVAYPLVLYSFYFLTADNLKSGKCPEIMITTIFYITVFSLIPHKEMRFLLPVFPFCVLALGYTLVRKVKSWGGMVRKFLYLSVLVELVVQGAYHVHHKLWVFTDYMLSKDTLPHSLFTTKRYD